MILVFLYRSDQQVLNHVQQLAKQANKQPIPSAAFGSIEQLLSTAKCFTRRKCRFISCQFLSAFFEKLNESETLFHYSKITYLFHSQDF